MERMSKLQRIVFLGGMTLSVLATLLVLHPVPVQARLASQSATPTDDSIGVTSVDELKLQRGEHRFYKATAHILVKTGWKYGFNVTMLALTPDLLHNPNPISDCGSVVIAAPKSYEPVDLQPGQWGFSLDQNATKFRHVPSMWQARPHDDPLLIAETAPDKLGKCASVHECDVPVTFAANLDSNSIVAGTYETNVYYTVTAKPRPPHVIDEPSMGTNFCQSGNAANSCKVDIDANMIPVRYDTEHAEWTSVAKTEDAAHQGEWYDYGQQQWANAVTVKKEARVKYKGKSVAIDPADILGYWVYVPRYAYEVMRRDFSNHLPVKPQNFAIHFEKATDSKRTPAPCERNSYPMLDYRKDCKLDRNYIAGQPSKNGTWATHPAFSFGKKELNGIWFAKFETTGTKTQPTVLPNQRRMTGADLGGDAAGLFYTLAKTVGAVDPGNVGGTRINDVPHNAHDLDKFSSRMINNKDWGALTYLSASKFGTGYNGLQSNNQTDDQIDADQNFSKGVTGCGAGTGEDYSDTGKLGTEQACSASHPEYAYNGTVGQHASTTGNVTGVYDMAGYGGYVAAKYVVDPNTLLPSSIPEFARPKYSWYRKSDPTGIGVPLNSPYLNTYNFSSFDKCTYELCGGQASYEVHNIYVPSGPNQWLNQKYDDYKMEVEGTWVYRGGSSDLDGNIVTGDRGIYTFHIANGGSTGQDGLHIVLGAFKQ